MPLWNSINTSHDLSLKTKLATYAFFLAVAFMLYAQSIGYDYVLDDKIVFTDNNYVKEGFSGIAKILSTESFMGYFSEQKDLVQGARYRPLSLITFNLEYQLTGLNKRLSHFLNIFFYGLCGFLTFICLHKLFQTKVNSKIWGGLAFLTAVIFLLHPIHVEAVANVKGRDEILSYLFSISSLYFAIKYIDNNKLLTLLFSGICYILGLLAKENTITFLFVIPFAAILFRPKNKKTIAKLTGLTLSLSLIYLVTRYQVVGYLMNSAPVNDLMNNSFAEMNGAQKYATIFYTLLEYLRLGIFPHPLTHDYYPYHIPKMEWSDWQVLLSLLIHIVLVVIATFSWKKNKVITFAIGYYIAALSIVSNLVISIGTFMNERFIFAASLGMCLLLVYVVNQLGKRINTEKSNLITYAIVGLIGIGFAYKSYTRVPAWKSELSLNKAAIKVSKNSARANSFMATALFNEYKKENNTDKKKKLLLQAEPYALKATEIHPNYYNGHLMRTGIAAEKYKYDRNLDNLLSEFTETIKIRPDVEYVKTYLEYLNSRADKNKLIDFYLNASENILIKQQRKYDWAVFILQIGLKVDPNEPRLRRAMRTAYTGLGRPEMANKYR